MSPKKSSGKSSSPSKAPKPGRRKAPPDKKSFPIVGIGASAGGLEACTQLLEHLPPDTGMGFVLVQHMAPRPHSMLPELLVKVTRMPVAEVQDGVQVKPNHIYITPPDVAMSLNDGVLHLIPRSEPRGRHRPIDRFLQSLAEDKGSLAIGVILSGTASDGVLGMKAIKAEGGITLVQDEATAKYFSMPQSAIVAGCVDVILPPDKIAKELARIARHPYVRPALPVKMPELPPAEKNGFNRILGLLKSATGVDFTFYKHSTLKRRILRRMALRQMERLEDYVKHLEKTPNEVEELYKDILINVTGFFRDWEVFEALKDMVFPEIIKNTSAEAPIRVWVPGCATGEEAYSLAICLLEFLGDKATHKPIQIFATDIEAGVIDQARAGIYPASIAADVSPERLTRFFIKAPGGYQISKTIREMCIFARQNLVKDPPFSNLDLISCRNVLIYMGQVLQRKVIPIFHFALKPTGFLLLGKSEALGAFSEFFALLDKKSKIFAKKRVSRQVAVPLHPAEYLPIIERPGKKLTQPSEAGWSSADLQNEADRLILSIYGPAGVIINEDMKILQFRGHTGPYLEPSPGEATLNLMRMLREGLELEVRGAVHVARKGERVRKEGLRVKHDGQFRRVNMEVVPLRPAPLGERFFLVLFEEGRPETEAPAALPGGAKPSKGKRPAKDQHLVQLQQELTATKEYLQTVIETQEVTLEELKSTNEELLSANEELQSINEEMETSKEELQSANEELATLNEELETRNQELSQVNNDLMNLLNSVPIAILMLGADLRLRRFNPMAAEMMDLVPADLGRSISDTRLSLTISELEPLIAEVIKDLAVKELEVQDRRGKWYSLVIRPYRTLDNKIEGAVLIMVDISDLKQSLLEVQEARDFSQAIVETVRDPLLVLKGDLGVVSANRSFYETFEIKPEEALNRQLYELGDRQWAIPELQNKLADILAQDAEFQDFEVSHDFPHIGRHLMLLHGKRLKQVASDQDLILLAIEDITLRRQAEEALREAEKLRYFQSRLFEFQEGERKRVSRELHDELGQSLATLKLQCRMIEKGLPADQEALKKNCQQACQQVDGMIDSLRRLSLDLSPSILEDFGLSAALKSFSERFCAYYGLSCSFEMEKIEKLLPKEVSIHVYRIFQEALHNVAKHAQATKTQLVIKGQADHLFFMVADDGQGFEVEEVLQDKAPDRGMGLASIGERVQLLGGALDIWSQKQAGTKISFTLPLPEPESSLAPEKG